MMPPHPFSHPDVPNFKVLAVLGAGTFGKVYKVERRVDRQVYAMKEAPLSSVDQMRRDAAVNEVRLMVSVHHSNVVRYHESIVANNKLYIVMEFAPCRDLQYYIRKLCHGLSALHAKLIIHRDLKPANIFMFDKDLLKIGDLGVAKALTHMDFTRSLAGTPPYMAPEVWASQPYSYSSDLWSLGAVLYEMMTFQTPVRANTEREFKAKILAGQYKPIPAGRYSADLIDICCGLLDVNPRKRPSLQHILLSGAASRWLHNLPTPTPSRRASEDGGYQALLSTIQVPQDLRKLNQNLPPPKYDTDQVAPALIAAHLPAAAWLPAPQAAAPAAALRLQVPPLPARALLPPAMAPPKLRTPWPRQLALPAVRGLAGAGRPHMKAELSTALPGQVAAQAAHRKLTAAAAAAPAYADAAGRPLLQAGAAKARVGSAVQPVTARGGRPPRAPQYKALHAAGLPTPRQGPLPSPGAAWPATAQGQAAPGPLFKHPQAWRS